MAVIAGFRPRIGDERRSPKEFAEKSAASTTDAVMSSETSVAEEAARNAADDCADDFAAGDFDRRKTNRQP